jgi:uncharacterized protein (DUF433 family)
MDINEALWQDENRVSGAVCFRGTRIPVSILFDYLETGSLEEFFRGYPDVSREQVHAVLEASKELVSERLASSQAH